MKTLYFILLTFISCLWLSEALMMVRHFKISAEMRRTFENAEYTDEDPLDLKDLTVRQTICDEVLKAREYHPKSTKNHVIPERTSSENQHVIDLETLNFQRIEGLSDGWVFARKNITFENGEVKEIVPAKLLECVRDPASERNWFVSFHGEGDQMFLIERVEWGPRKSRYKWTAWLEMVADYNLIYHGQLREKRLFEYFLNQVKSDERGQTRSIKKIPKKMTLCFLTFNEHARLCSVAFETLNYYSSNYFQLDMRDVNYVNIAAKRCKIKRIELKPSKVATANVIACSINQDTTKPQFFILADCQVPGAVFILTETEQTPKRLQLRARLENIAVLLERPSAD